MGGSTCARTCAALALLGLLAPAGCGAQPRASTDRSAGQATEYVYDGKDTVEGEPFKVHVDAVVVGTHHVRVSLEETGMAPQLYVWDGQRLLVHDPESFRPWILYEAPAEHPDTFQLVQGYLPDPGGSRLKHDCRSATVIGHKMIRGREATGYRCAAQHFPDGSSMSAYVVWVDAHSGLQLQQGSFHLSSVKQDPSITSATFSTQPPSGAKVQRFGVRAGPGGSTVDAKDFHLKRADGTAVSLSDYAGKPVVLVFASSDLAFGMREACPRCASALRTLRTETSGGTRPAVLLILAGEQGKPGFPLTLPGVSFDQAADPEFEVQSSYGFDDQAAFALIGSDGKVHDSFNEVPTDDRLRAALAALK